MHPGSIKTRIRRATPLSERTDDVQMLPANIVGRDDNVGIPQVVST